MKKAYWIFVGLLATGLIVFCFGCENPNGNGYGTSSTSHSRIAGAGIGVSNIQRSIDFYTTVLELDDAGSRPGKLDRIVEEHILTDRDGQEIALMDFGPNEDCRRRPGKLVFAVSNTTKYFNKALANGATSVSRPLLCRDPDGYIVEFYARANVGKPLLVAVGVGATNLRKSQAFYQNVLGFKYSMGMPVVGLMTERILQSPGSTRGFGDLVIMNYTARMDYANVPAKVTFHVQDAVGFANAIKADNPGNILLEPTATSVGYAKDIEGTLLEIIQK